jgi:hypothetical protein
MDLIKRLASLSYLEKIPQNVLNWLVQLHLDPTYAESLADTSITIEQLDKLAKMMSNGTLDVYLK